jgi:ribonucleoside-diphosphate reductase alpha chain
MATLQEVTAASLDYFNGDKLAANVFATKYPLTLPDGDILEMTPDVMHRRMSREFARVESKYSNPMSEDAIYELLKDFRYVIPQGSPMSGIGNVHQLQSLSNCFVVESPYDSYGGIMKTDQELVQIMKRRGGVGSDVSSLRPEGMGTSNAAKTSTGIVSFMERYSNTTREVAQNGRRGALMISVSVHHPQILDFIRAKRNRDKVTGANISIRLTDEFMEAVVANEDYEVRFPVDSAEPLISERISAKEIWDEIVESAWQYAEPGLLFWDSVTKFSPADIYADFGFKTISTNPCGEIPLCAYDSCRLMVVNLLSFVQNPFTEQSAFDFNAFSLVVQQAQRLMDDLIDLELEQVEKIIAKIEADPEPEEIKQGELSLWRKVREKAVNGRRTGLGVTAIGDMLAALGIRYGSDESIEFVEEVYKTLNLNAYRSSCQLAKERGAFPLFDFEREQGHPFMERIWEANPELRELMRVYGRRNIALLTTAPAGSVSILTKSVGDYFGVTSGIEQATYLNLTRRKKIMPGEDVAVDFVDQNGDEWTEFEVSHAGFKAWTEITGHSVDDVEKSPYCGATIDDVDWVAKVKMQAAAQKWVCHAISNTTNLPEDVDKDVVSQVYLAGWQSGCKGVTVYREGSRTGVIVKESAVLPEDLHTPHSAVKRPEELPCEIHQVSIKGEKWTILVGMMSGLPYEVMGGLSEMIEIPRKYKQGTLIKRSRKTMPSIYDLKVGENGDEFKIKDIVDAFDNPEHSTHTRLLSLGLRHGASVHYVAEQLHKGDKESDLFSFSKVLARVLKKYIDDGTKPGGSANCPDCGAEDSMRYTEGCVMCLSCGQGKCA